MRRVPSQEQDPIFWCAAIAFAFLALVWHRLGIPSRIYFDEIHYVPAARKLLHLIPANMEHPMVGKEAIAAAIALLGDKPLFWRIPSALLGTLGLFAFGRGLWWISRRRFATLAGMILLATGFTWFIQSRIAMLDMVMAGLGMTALWQFAATLDKPAHKARPRLALTALLLGLALGAKWSIAPAVMLLGLAMLAIRLREHGLRFLTAKKSRALSGITLIEAGLWLGLLPLLIYWLTFAPGFFFDTKTIGPLDFIDHHRHMIALQDSVVKLHPYRSVWYQWIVNWRPIWYLYEQADGAQRGILFIGNPFTMLAGLPAVLWCLWAGLLRQRRDALALALLYLGSLVFWIVTEKPIQFYYHYLLPSAFLLGCLALALDALWRKGGTGRWITAATLAGSLGMFVFFYPIISSAPLKDGPPAFSRWMWMESWR